MTSNIRTMQDLFDNLDSLGYSKATQNQIRPRIADCARIYNRPLNQIPADYEAFDREWGQGRVDRLPDGFESIEKFIEFRKRVKAALSKVDAPAKRHIGLSEASMDVIAAIDKHSGPPPMPIGPHAAISVTMVARVATSAGYELRDLDPEKITAIAMPLIAGDRRTFKLGIKRINVLAQHPAIFEQIADYLPPLPLPQPDRVKAVPSPWRRNGGENTQQLWQEFDHFVALKRGVDGLGRPKAASDTDFGQRTAETYENAINKATGVLSKYGRIASGDILTLRDVCSLQFITEFADLWQTRILDGEVGKDKSTLHLDVQRLGHIALHMKYLLKSDRKALKKLQEQVRTTAPRRARMSAEREAWIENFARDTRQQNTVRQLPELLMHKSQRLLDRWQTLKQDHKQKSLMQALHLRIAAAQAAVLFYGSPLRAKNLRQMTFRGPDAELTVDAAKGLFHIDISGEKTKNRAAIKTPCDEEIAVILNWYLSEIRPRLINDHPYGHHLSDSDYLFPSRSPAVEMEETTFANHYRIGVNAAGVNMTLHQARHICVFFILQEDPNAITLAAAVLADEPGTVKAHYAFIDKIRALVAGRALLKQSRSKIRKHRIGERV